MMSSMCSMPTLKPDHLRLDAGLALLLGRHLPVRGRGRMAGQRLGVAHIDQPLDQLERVVETLAGLEPALDAESQQRAGAAAEIFLRQRVIGVVGKARVIDPGDAGIGAQKFGDAARVLDMALDAQRHGLDALQQQEGASAATAPRRWCADRRCGSARYRRRRRNARCRPGRDRTRRASLNIGKALARARFQGKRPLSTMAPPSVVPWPPMNLVSECTTMSAPYSIGRSRIGVATVLSTISGTPCACATAASASMSQMLPAGLPTLSQKTARVLSSISFSIAAGAVGFGKAHRDALARQHVREQRVGGAVELRHRDDVACPYRRD